VEMLLETKTGGCSL